MDNENKNFQGSVDETELQEKVMKDVSEKIAEAAAEVQDEIDSAAEAVELADVEVELEENEWAEEIEEEIPVKEPVIVSLKLSSLILSLVGTAIIGALLLLGGMQIPKWVDAIPEGSTVVKVDDAEITDADLKYYIYVSAMQYFQQNAEDPSQSPADFDWAKEAEDGKTVEELVKEQALDMAIDEVLLMNIGDKNGAEFDAEGARANAKMQTDQLVSAYNKELVELNAKRQALTSIKQYNRKIEQSMHMQAVQSDMDADPAKYYPEDKSVLEPFVSDEGASYKQILILKDTEEGADNEAKKKQAQEIYTRIQNDESFEDLMAEFNEDTAQTDEGYSFEVATAQMGEVENAVMALAVNTVSKVVETEEGFHVIKRTVGALELEKFWEAEAKIKVKERKIKKMSVAEILKEVDEATEGFETLYDELESQKSGN